MSIPLSYLIKPDDVADTIIVKRTGRIHVPYNETISYFCHLSKNLWNQAHHFVLSSKEYMESKMIPTYSYIDGIMNKTSYYIENGKYNQSYDNYHNLGGATAQQILMIYDKSWKSFKRGNYGYFNNSNSANYTGRPKEPKYKKKDGEFELIFTNRQCKFRERKDGSIYMKFPKNIKDKNGKPLIIKLGNVNDNNNQSDKSDRYLINKLMWSKFDQVRIIPKGTGYWIEIVYDKEVLKDKLYKSDEDIIMSIDLGVNNIVAITDNIGNRPIVINSDILKSVNQWYNKRSSELKSIYDRNKIGCFLKKDKNGNIRYLTNKTGNKLDILTENRNNFVLDVLHKLSRYIVEHALSIKSKTIAFGRNPFWKQSVNLGKRNNQNFVQIPHKKLIDMTRYKVEEYGIDVIYLLEDHTSKCSFLDSEKICHHDKYIGKRGKKGDGLGRGMFEASKGTKIQSDVQGSYNILRRVADKISKKMTKFDNVYPKFDVFDIMEGVAVHGLVPKRLSISDLMRNRIRSELVVK